MSKISISYPESGLNPTISVVNTTTNIEDFSGVMSEVGTTKVYIYEFTEVVNTDYVYVIKTAGYTDISDAIFYSTSSGGLTTEEHDKLMGITGGGGYAVSQGLDAQDKKYLKETHEKVLKLENTDLSGIEKSIYEIKSQNEIAKEYIIDTIKETEIEVCSDIVRVKTELKKDNITTRNLVRQKTKNLAEQAQKQIDIDREELELMKDIQEEFEESEKLDIELEKEFENQEMEDIEKEFENQEKETKQP